MKAYSIGQVAETVYNTGQYLEYEPEGELFAELDFKVWGERLSLHCYFTEVGTGRKFRLTAFRSRTNPQVRRYTPRDDRIDFSEPGIEGQCYRLQTARSRTGRLAWKRAELFYRGSFTGAPR